MTINRRAASVGIVVGVAAIHAFRLGSLLPGLAQRAYYAWASDILLPFTMYFILCLAERRLPGLRDWRLKAALVLAAAWGAELMQGLGVPALGSTFDPVDFAMYGIGVLAAVILDRMLLTRH